MVSLVESKSRVLRLIDRDLDGSGMENHLGVESPDRDPGKFVLADKPARIIAPFNGYFTNISLDWFAGSTEPPSIQNEPFHWYVFAFIGETEAEDNYFICSYQRLRAWVLEFDAPAGNDHRDHHDWRCDFKFPEQGHPWFYWGDDSSEAPVNKAREVQLNNVIEVLEEEFEGQPGALDPMSDEGIYRVGGKYKDSQNTNSADQFMRWLNIDGSKMGNSGGIRPLPFASIPPPSLLNGAIVLMTNRVKSRPHNPWEDIIDLDSRRIIYWGDAKYHESKGIDDWKGNQALKAAWDACIEGRRTDVPPLLHFTKEKVGWVVFNGLCALENLQATEFEDEGRPVLNYRANLRVLGAQEVSAIWLKERRCANTVAEGDRNAPPAWIDYRVAGLDPVLSMAPTKANLKLLSKLLHQAGESLDQAAESFGNDDS